jgi:sec-independent protein translocase protein TatB
VFGVNGGEFLVLILVLLLVVGPERLPRYAEQLGGWVRQARVFLREAKARVDEELGDEVKDVDWAALDPRQYDPRRIVREALLEDVAPAAAAAPAVSPGVRTYTSRGTAGSAAARSLATPGAAPFDDEAT